MGPETPRAARNNARAAGPLSSAGRRRLRFPCGHTDVEAGVRSEAAEAAERPLGCCLRCNVVALIVARVDRP
jgi:hypothetical protein